MEKKLLAIGWNAQLLVLLIRKRLKKGPVLRANSKQFTTYWPKKLSAADVKMEIPVLVRSLKSSILSSTGFQMGKKTF